MEKLLRFKIVIIVSLAALCLVSGGWLWAHFALRGVSNAPLILHFDDLSGITSVGSMGNITFMGILGIATVLMNSAIALALVERDRLLGNLTVAITLIFAILLFIAFAAIINVN